MSREYEGNPSAICMNQRKGECAGLGGKCPCEDFRPTYLITPEDAQILFPGARDRSINPGGIHYKSRHTRTAGEHRYPREDIVIDTYGNKLIGGYLDNYKSEKVEKNDKIKRLCKQHPKISLLCSHCGEKKRFRTEDLLARDVFVYECRSCSGRNSFKTSKITYDALDSVELIYEAEKYVVIKSLGTDILWINSDGKEIRLTDLSRKQSKLFLRFKNECVFNANSNICVYTGVQKANKCNKKRCDNYLCLDNKLAEAEKIISTNIIPCYRATLNRIDSKEREINNQLKKCICILQEHELSGLPDDDMIIKRELEKGRLEQKLKSLLQNKDKIKRQYNTIVSLTSIFKSEKKPHKGKDTVKSTKTLQYTYESSSEDKDRCLYYCKLISYCLRDSEAREGRPYACAMLSCPHFKNKKGNEKQYEHLVERDLKSKCIERLQYLKEEIAQQEAETLKLSQKHCDTIGRDAPQSEKDKCSEAVRRSIKKTDQLKKNYESAQNDLSRVNDHLAEFKKNGNKK